MLNREQIKNEVPLLWRQRAKAGLCPVCGKTSPEFDKGMRVYCSVKCRDEYARKFTHWSNVKDKFLRDHGEICDCCGITREEHKKKRGELLDKLRNQWLSDPKNRELIEQKRDELLVEWSRSWDERYKDLMDDKWILDHQLWDIDRGFEVSLPEFVHFEVDHKIALVNGGDMWDVANLQILCIECHKKKTKEDVNKSKKHRYVLGK